MKNSSFLKNLTHVLSAICIAYPVSGFASESTEPQRSTHSNVQTDSSTSVKSTLPASKKYHPDLELLYLTGLGNPPDYEKSKGSASRILSVEAWGEKYIEAVAKELISNPSAPLDRELEADSLPYGSGSAYWVGRWRRIENSRAHGNMPENDFNYSQGGYN